MSVGFVLMTHTALHRTAQVARHWARQGCPIVLHVDSRVSRDDHLGLVEALADLPDIRFCARRRCEWGTWSLVQASQTASEMMLSEFPKVRHVYLASGSCLPLRPVSELVAYLDARPRTDFIESVTTEEVDWAVGGLEGERFKLRFPFAWKRNRWLFDRFVELQRGLRLYRRQPEGLVPHLGSQWWCLTRKTLQSILEDPARGRFDQFFRFVWIPDESYYQTMARRYATHIESRSLTLSKFDFQGKPHVFYDDHLHLLRRSDCFVARKIWPRANRLYETFLGMEDGRSAMAEPAPGKIDRVFSAALERRTRGRSGLYMQSRFPNQDWENGKTAAPYSVLQGFADLFENFETWMGRRLGIRVHGNLFDPDKVRFAGDEAEFKGCLTASATIRDYNPERFLSNLIWNTRGERQIFQFSPRDNQDIAWFLTSDSNAQICVISGAWAVPLYRSNRPFADLRREAAALQKREVAFLNMLREVRTRAEVRIWTLAEFIEEPMENVQGILDAMGGPAMPPLIEAPRMADLSGFPQFLQSLKNDGMSPHVMGDFPATLVGSGPQAGAPPRPFAVR